MGVLEKRSIQVLHAIVSEYIASGDPVGSRTVARKHIALSAASIRNIMSDLTEWGYITQPHVSAGRIPTDLGYRFYVDTVIHYKPLEMTEQAGIEHQIRAAGLDVRDLLRQSSAVLADLSRQAGVVTGSPADEQTFKTIEFIRAAQDRIVVVLVSTSGFVQNKMIFDEDNIDQDTLDRYARMLNDMLKDLDLHEAKERIEQELATEKAKVDAMLSRALRLGHMLLSRQTLREVFIEGQANIFDDPEFSQIEKIKAVLTTFEEKSKLLRILDKTFRAKGILILIGSEHGLDAMESCSIIAYPLRTEEGVIGSVGVVGSKRMNYPKVVSLVDTTARILLRLLRRMTDRVE
jgi:heat-inducible transcriptional repressor